MPAALQYNQMRGSHLLLPLRGGSRIKTPQCHSCPNGMARQQNRQATKLMFFERKACIDPPKLGYKRNFSLVRFLKRS